jgi:uncharacterized membrane protein (DUF485 family)
MGVVALMGNSGLITGEVHSGVNPPYRSSDMQSDVYKKIKEHPDFIALVAKRRSFAVGLSAVVLVMYFAFILTIAFAPALLGTPVAEGSVITWGIPVGLIIIISSFLLTGIYVKRANSEFDDENRRIVEECLK